MKYAIIVSKNDIAGMNVRERLIEECDFHKEEGSYEENQVYGKEEIKLYTLSRDTIHAENLDKDIDADFFIFATRHQSKAGKHSLSCHTPGNWGKAEAGGQSGKLCVASGIKLKHAFLELKSYQGRFSSHDITLECTHHGPYIEKPCMFIEIGSTEEHWGNKEAGEVIAKTIMKIIEEDGHSEQRIAIGLGGPHYCNNFTKVIERTDIAVSHICPKYHLEGLNEGMLRQALERTKEKVDLILLDWKGLGKEKERMKFLAEKMKIPYERIDKLLK
jgi:D-aminoacyl-tRNA deacylase